MVDSNRVLIPEAVNYFRWTIFLLNKSFCQLEFCNNPSTTAEMWDGRMKVAVKSMEVRTSKYLRSDSTVKHGHPKLGQVTSSLESTQQLS